MKKKSLSCGKEEFFVASALLFGTPSRMPFQYVAPRFQPAQGVAAWCNNHPDGKCWSEHVSNFGEAKARAWVLYIEFLAWSEKDRDVDPICRSDIYLPREWRLFEELTRW